MSDFEQCIAKDDSLIYKREHRIKRQLSVQYQYQGHMTADDPDGFPPEEKQEREEALLFQQPHTGYADAIRLKRLQTIREQGFFKPYDSTAEIKIEFMKSISTLKTLLFTSLWHFFEASGHAIKTLFNAGEALLVSPFDSIESEEKADFMILHCMKMKDHFILGIHFALATVLHVLESTLKLISNSATTLVVALNQPKEENFYCGL